MDESKSILASKTFWFNAISLMLAVLAAVLPIIEADASATILKWIAIITAVGNVILRFLTTQPVEMRLPGK